MSSWFAIEITSEHVEPPPEPQPPTVVHGGGEAGFFGPILPEPVEFRFRARRAGLVIQPFQATFSTDAPSVRSYSSIVQLENRVVRRIEFRIPGRREPAYQWSSRIRDDEDLLELLFA
jgi:hypothetical protein